MRFGVFEVHLAARELRKSGVRIRLQEKPFRLLAILLARPGEVVTREELQQELWPNEEYGEFDLGLNTAVKKLRQALNDSADSPKWIETVPRVGYRFLGATGELQPRVTQAADAGAVTAPPRWRIQPWAAATVGGIALAAAGWYFVGSRPSSVSLDPAQMSELPLTSYQGNEVHPTFSPDGSQVAYARKGDGDDGWNIYVEVVGSHQPKHVTESEGNDLAPAWSPDGKWIAFWRSDAGSRDAEILLVPALGGPARPLLEQPLPDSEKLSWSPDGARLAFSSRSESGGPFRLGLLTVDNAGVEWLTSPPPEFHGDSRPAFSPDGSSLAFMRSTGLGSGQNVFVLPLSKDFKPVGEPKQLTAFERKATAPAWMPDGREILFLGEQGPGQEGIWSVAASGDGEPRLVWRQAGVLPLNADPSLAVSRDPQGVLQMAYVWGEPQESDIYKVDLVGPNRGKGTALIATTRRDSLAKYSPDGRWIAYYSGWPERDLYVCDIDGANSRRLTYLHERVASHASWSPDSQKIAFLARVKGGADIYVVGLAGGEPRQLTQHPAEDMWPVWSHDSKWVFFNSTRSGTFAVWKVAPEGGDVQRATEDGFLLMDTAKDGTKDYYLRTAESARQGTWEVARTPLPEQPPDLNSLSFELCPFPASIIGFTTRSGLYFTRGYGGPSTLYHYDPASRELKELFPVEGGLTSVHPQETSILITRTGRPPGVDLKLLRENR